MTILRVTLREYLIGLAALGLWVYAALLTLVVLAIFKEQTGRWPYGLVDFAAWLTGDFATWWMKGP